MILWQAKKESGVFAIYAKMVFIAHFSLKPSNMQAWILWVKIRNQSNKQNFVVGVYYRPANQGDKIDEEFFLQLQEASCSSPWSW